MSILVRSGFDQLRIAIGVAGIFINLGHDTQSYYTESRGTSLKCCVA